MRQEESRELGDVKARSVLTCPKAPPKTCLTFLQTCPMFLKLPENSGQFAGTKYRDSNRAYRLFSMVYRLSDRRIFWGRVADGRLPCGG
jgi:hypothetical protein